MPDPVEIDDAARAVIAAVLEHSGYDFGEYQRPFVIRRLHHVADRHRMAGGIPELAGALEDNDALTSEIIETLSVGVTEMFRDPPFWTALRETVLPWLAESTGPLRAWVAGCATGEEAYSLTILLSEAGIADRCRVYATDINESALTVARDHRLRAQDFVLAQENYRASGGTELPSDFFDVDDAGARFSPGAIRSIVFSRHNLVTDSAFNSFQLILCRNVLIYFNADLHARAHDVLFDSLMPGGVLGLGWRESIRISPHRKRFDTVDLSARLYRRRP